MMVLRHLTAHILEEMHFLQKQLKSKDEMINSLSQLVKYNDMLQLQQSNQSSSLSSLSSSYYLHHHYHHLYH